MRSTALWLKALIVPILLLASSSQSADRARSADDSYLDALIGSWDMRGTLGGKPVRYHVQAALSDPFTGLFERHE